MGEAWRTRMRLVVVRDDGRVLTLGGRLPEVEVPGQVWSAVVPKVVAAFAPTGIEPVVLRRLAGAVDEAGQLISVTLLAVLGGDGPHEARWVHPDEVPDAADLLADAGPAQQPWADPSWLPAAETWLRSVVAATGAEATGPVVQHKVWQLSSVLRMPTTTGDVYLKATVDSPLFAPEAAVTALLAGLFPRHVPAPIAVDPGRGWIATPSFGAELGWETPRPVLQEVLRQYAALQQESVGHVGTLRTAGCLDRGPAWLGDQLAHWFAPETTGHWVAPDHARRLAAAVPRLAELCAELAGSPLPVTLLHGDLHMGNVAARPDGGYLFFDWTDAAVGHPFVDMIAVVEEEDELGRAVLAETYLAEWAGAADPVRLARDWAVAEVLLHANQAVSYMSLGLSLRQHPAAPADPLFASYTGQWLHRVLGALDRLDGTGGAGRATRGD